MWRGEGGACLAHSRGGGAAVGCSAAAPVVQRRAETWAALGKGGKYSRVLPVARGARGSGRAHTGSRGCGRPCRAV